MTEAAIGYGAVLELALASKPDEFIHIKEMFSGTPPSSEDDQVDATHHQSPNGTREFIAGLTEPGEAAYEMNYAAGSPTDKFIRSVKGKKLIARHTFPNGVPFIYRCLRQSYEQDAPLDDKMTATLTLKASGNVIMAPVAAPRVLETPAIEGVAKVGLPLTARSGQWAGAMRYSYQWFAGEDEIEDATGEALVVTAAEIGKVITVKVTAENDSFETEAASAPTAAAVA